VAWYCTRCEYVYNVASDTLMYPIGGKPYDDSFNEHCPNCDLKLKRIFRHENPQLGVQRFISMGWYCNRCRYVWLDKKKN